MKVLPILYTSAIVITLNILVSQCAGKATDQTETTAVEREEDKLTGAVERTGKLLADHPRQIGDVAPLYQDDDDLAPDSSEIRGGIKIKKKKKPKLKLKKSKKFLKKFLPFLLIPLLIQAKLIPLFLFKLKLIALKALGIGKLALILIAINVIYTAMHKGQQDHNEQYSQEVLAQEHYGYNGGTEVGAYVHGRMLNMPGA